MLAQKILGTRSRRRRPRPRSVDFSPTSRARRFPKDGFQPSNITWACVAPLENDRDVVTKRRLKKKDRYEALAKRAVSDLDAWLSSAPLLSRVRAA